jgi:hypothetical protein
MMATKQKRTAAAVQAVPEKKDNLSERLAVNSSVSAAAVVEVFAKGPFGNQDIAELASLLNESMDALNGGNMKKAENMLLGQAYALQSIFVSLARKAENQEYLKQYETHLRLALKAQSQCRSTLETLAAIKNPPIVYARQANIANGPQQVNNGVSEPVRTGAHAHGKIPIQPNELSGDSNELLPDARASRLTIPANQEVEAMGEINRAEIGGG